MASCVFPSAKVSMLNGTFNLDTDDATLHCALMHGYVLDDAHDFFDDVVADEVATAGNYVHLGEPLTGSAISAAHPDAMWDAADVAWANATIHATGAIIFMNRGGLHSADDLVAWIDFGGNKDSTAAEFKIAWNVAGIMTIA